MPSKIDIKAGAILRRLRLRAGFSQGTLAKAAKVSYQQIAKYENGTDRLTFGRLFKICKILGVTPPEFITILFTEITKVEK